MPSVSHVGKSLWMLLSPLLRACMQLIVDRSIMVAVGQHVNRLCGISRSCAPMGYRPATSRRPPLTIKTISDQ
ncbi:hypothetical protein B0I35DRAFT_77588 [Stachybotrys elegans]|uniref:Secreted protein n=1 Tax=Stachybotrys elegans TaxID=80388 RepID=A0A8K0SNJ8_9HYPO|nr:hypothetical protein B0I35DRAFT_77588 [Stachybotrys elegans]